MLDQYAERWALVTGASSGIGREFARQLAARGMHLVLTARREDRLRELAEELDSRHAARCEVIPADLSQPDQVGAMLEQIRQRRIRIDLLVNNAGFGVIGDFDHASPERVQEMLRVNVSALTELTYRLLPGMLERGHGGVINVASLAGFQPVAYMGAYAATKAYIMHFSESLSAELHDRKVTVTAVCPGMTKTEFFEIAGAEGWLRKFSSHSPEVVARKGLKAFERRRMTTVIGWQNKLIPWCVRFITRRRAVQESKRFFRSRPKAASQNKRDVNDESPATTENSKAAS